MTQLSTLSECFPIEQHICASFVFKRLELNRLVHSYNVRNNSMCNQHTNLLYVPKFKLLVTFHYQLSKIGLNQLAVFGGYGEKYCISNVPRDSQGFERRVAYTFFLSTSISTFILLFSLSLLDFFPLVPIVCFLYNVTLQKSLFLYCVIFHKPFAFKDHGLKAVYMPDFTEHSGQSKNFTKAWQSNNLMLNI